MYIDISIHVHMLFKIDLFYLFLIFSRHPVYSVATADFYQEKIVAPLAVRVNGYLLEDGNFIFRFVAHDYEKMVLTSNTGNIILTGWLKVPAAENRWKKVSTWTNNNMAYSIKNFKGYGGNNGGNGLIYLFSFNLQYL